MDTNNSFHRRPLPSTCISLSSQRGQELFQSALRNNGTKAFFDLISQYHTQTEPAYCGPSTLVMILNALNVDPRKPWKPDAPWRWYSEEMLNCCIDLETIKKTGITFSTFVCLAKCQGLCADEYYASSSTVEEFQRIVEKSCCGGDGSGNHSGSSISNSDHGDDDTFRNSKSSKNHCQECNALQEQQQPKMYLAVSLQSKSFDNRREVAISLPLLHMTKYPIMFLYWTPHDSNMFLIGFLWICSFGPCNRWILRRTRAEDFIALSFEPDEQIYNAGSLVSSSLTGNTTTTATTTATATACLYLPQSILFRSKRSQNPARRQFQAFLKNEPRETSSSLLTFSQVYNYWTDHGTNIRKVWSILEPAPVPIDEEGCDTVKRLLSLIRELLRCTWSMDHSSNRANRNNHGKDTNSNSSRTSSHNNTNMSNISCNMRSIIMEDMDDKFVPCSMRTVHITALETIYVIYLSTLEKSDASKIILKGIEKVVSSQKGDATTSSSNNSSENGQVAAVETSITNDIIISQLLAEADLIQKAIEFSNYQNCSRRGCCS
jgi:Phytochelatin synthase.